MRTFTNCQKRCPWCGRGLWQSTDAPGTAESHTTAKCNHCGYRYEARLDPTSGQIVENTAPGTADERLPDMEESMLGPPEELPPEYFAWVRQQINDAMDQDWYDALEDDQDEQIYD